MEQAPGILCLASKVSWLVQHLSLRVWRLLETCPRSADPGTSNSGGQAVDEPPLPVALGMQSLQPDFFSLPAYPDWGHPQDSALAEAWDLVRETLRMKKMLPQMEESRRWGMFCRHFQCGCCPYPS